MSADIFGFADFGELDPVANQAMLVFMIVYMIMMAFALVYAAVVYVLQAVGVYTVAKRRCIHHSWLAWVPVANMWVLGSISDQYQFVAKGKIRNRRKVLLGLLIAVYVLLIAFFVALGASVFQLNSLDSGFRASIVASTMGAIWIYLVAWVVSIVALVFQYIVYYDLFASCSPNNAVVFLVLSIFFTFLLPFFVFACRKKDEGMPPRRVQVPIAPWTPAQEPPAAAWQQPVQSVEEPIIVEESVAEESIQESDET